ncbi:hypothetical protein [Photobacterium damselae]|uniref:hypothetical protein n=1 Tax=Photobacterium damselae TaxID=38293 RepID=UPI004068158E
MNNTLFKKILFSGFGSVLSKGGIYFITVFLSHKLSSADFAIYSLILTTVTYLGSLSTLGMSIIITDLVSKNDIGKKVINVLYKKILPFSSVFFSIVGFFIIEGKINNDIYFTLLIYLLVLGICFELYFSSIVSGKNDFEYLAKINIIKSLLTIGSIFLFLINTNVYYFFISYGFALLISNFMLFIKVNSYSYKDGITLCSIVSRASPLLLSDLLVPGFIWGVGIYLASSLSIDDMARFNMINQLGVLSIFIVNALLSPILPHINSFGRDNEVKYIYIPCFVFFVFSLFISYTDIYTKLIGNNLLINERTSINIILSITLISIFKLGLIRKNIQKGNTYISLFSNVFWFISVLISSYYIGLDNVENVFKSLFIAHICSLLFSIYIYIKVKVINKMDIFNVYFLVLFFMIFYLVV